MTFKPAIWYPIAALLTAFNLVWVGLAGGAGEPWHATAHAGLAVAFGFWAQRLRRGRLKSELQDRIEAPEVLDALDALEGDVSQLRQELAETQERLDFVERRLAQGTDPRRMDPPR